MLQLKMKGAPGCQASGYRLVAWLFLRCLALIYLAAFASLAVQIEALAGAQGIFPIAEQLAEASSAHGILAWLAYPSLFWIASGDGTLLAVAWGGAALSLVLLLWPWLGGGVTLQTPHPQPSAIRAIGAKALTARAAAAPPGCEGCEWIGWGRAERVLLILLYLLYLSLFHAGQFFTNFQWDYLLLETGFLAILLPGGPRLVVWLFRWLLFRLRFESGLAKLLSGDPGWRDLTALRFYFETQPLPHPGAWIAHHLPDWLLRVGGGGTLFVELVVPFFIFLPRPWRHFAAWITILWQLLIIATSNHNFFNLLIICLCLFLFDDQAMARVLPLGWRRRALASRILPQRPGAGMRALTLILALLLVPLSLVRGAELALGGPITGLQPWLAPLEPFRLANRYHVFPTIERERIELVLEASPDGVDWQPLDFRYRPDDPAQAPVFIVPHQPRLDWMLWFVPRNPLFLDLFERFLLRLREGSPAVTALLARPPTGEAPPGWLRVRLYRYHFVRPAEIISGGAWWRREDLGPFYPLPLL